MGYAIQHHATHRFARISVRKVRPLLDLIRGHYADDALDLLKYMPHRGRAWSSRCSKAPWRMPRTRAFATWAR